MAVFPGSDDTGCARALRTPGCAVVRDSASPADHPLARVIGGGGGYWPRHSLTVLPVTTRSATGLLPDGGSWLGVVTPGPRGRPLTHQIIVYMTQ